MGNKEGFWYVSENNTVWENDKGDIETTEMNGEIVFEEDSEKKCKHEWRVSGGYWNQCKLCGCLSSRMWYQSNNK